mmetsp:Transcript_92551/g.264432  ORF Transcript_92551/g.264432 Transcript_92551/m.264432 type:complete len:438 (-) Transcript_92551:616-1929(-)
MASSRISSNFLRSEFTPSEALVPLARIASFSRWSRITCNRHPAVSFSARPVPPVVLAIISRWISRWVDVMSNISVVSVLLKFDAERGISPPASNATCSFAIGAVSLPGQFGHCPPLVLGPPSSSTRPAMVSMRPASPAVATTMAPSFTWGATSSWTVLAATPLDRLFFLSFPLPPFFDFRPGWWPSISAFMLELGAAIAAKTGTQRLDRTNRLFVAAIEPKICACTADRTLWLQSDPAVTSPIVVAATAALSTVTAADHSLHVTRCAMRALARSVAADARGTSVAEVDGGALPLVRSRSSVLLLALSVGLDWPLSDVIDMDTARPPEPFSLRLDLGREPARDGPCLRVEAGPFPSVSGSDVPTCARTGAFASSPAARAMVRIDRSNSKSLGMRRDAAVATSTAADAFEPASVALASPPERVWPALPPVLALSVSTGK